MDDEPVDEIETARFRMTVLARVEVAAAEIEIPVAIDISGGEVLLVGAGDDIRG